MRTCSSRPGGESERDWVFNIELVGGVEEIIWNWFARPAIYKATRRLSYAMLSPPH